MAGHGTRTSVRVLVALMATTGLLAGLALAGPTGAGADTPGHLIAGGCAPESVVLRTAPLYDLPLGGGTATELGDVTVGGYDTCLTGLAWDPGTGTLFGIGARFDQLSRATDSLLDVPLTAGDATVLGTIDFSGDLACGLEWDDTGQRLWTAAYYIPGLYTVDPANGDATLVGAPGVDESPCALAYVPGSGLLYTIDHTGAGALYAIDPATGGATYVGDTGIEDACSIAYDTDHGVMYAGEDNADAHLYEVDLTTGAATDLGPTGAASLCGMAYIPAVVDPPTTTTTTAPATTTTAATTAAPLAAAAATPRFTG